MIKKTILILLCCCFMVGASGCYIQSKLMTRDDAVDTAIALQPCTSEEEIDTILSEHIYGMLQASDLYIILASAPPSIAPLLASKLTPFVLDSHNLEAMYEPFIEEVKTVGLNTAKDAESKNITQYLGYIQKKLNDTPIVIDEDLYQFVEYVLQFAPPMPSETVETTSQNSAEIHGDPQSDVSVVASDDAELATIQEETQTTETAKPQTTPNPENTQATDAAATNASPNNAIPENTQATDAAATNASPNNAIPENTAENVASLQDANASHTSDPVQTTQGDANAQEDTTQPQKRKRIDVKNPTSNSKTTSKNKLEWAIDRL